MNEADLPALSCMAWQKLVDSLEPAAATHIASGLRIQGLPGASKIAALPDDEWVLQYEAIQEKLARQQRKKGTSQSGVFYTPVEVADYLTRRSLGETLKRAEAAIQQKIQTDNNVEAANQIVQTIQQLRVIDPACGTGVFLVAALKLLADFYRRLAENFPALALATPAQWVYTSQLYGIDIDPISIIITELRLAQWVNRLDGEPLAFTQNAYNPHLHCADTLQMDSLQTPGNQINLTQSDLTQVQNGLFPRQWDFILGNPPYVSQVRRQSNRFYELKQQNSNYYQPKMDLCDAFLGWAIDHIKPQGQVVFVLPEYLTQRASSAPLRLRLWQEGQIREFWTFQQNQWFKNAPGHHSAFLIWQKESTPAEAHYQMVSSAIQSSENCLDEKQLQPTAFRLDTASGKLLYGNPLEISLLKKLSLLPPLLKKNDIQQGIVMPQGRLKKSERHRLSNRNRGTTLCGGWYFFAGCGGNAKSAVQRS